MTAMNKTTHRSLVVTLLWLTIEDKNENEIQDI